MKACFLSTSFFHDSWLGISPFEPNTNPVKSHDMAFPRMVDARILIVEDDPDILEVLGEFLNRKGTMVVGKAKNGLEAFEQYRDQRPDVVLMDIMMPQYDGIYGLEKILGLDPKAKIIIVTGCVSESRDQLKRMGAVEVLSKPCEFDRIFGVIDKITNQVLA